MIAIILFKMKVGILGIDRKYMKILLLLLSFSFLSCKESRETDTVTYVIPEHKLQRIQASDRTIQIDPTFPYYLDRSVESIADEIVLAGFKAVHYFVVNENYVNGELIKAFQDRGLPVWLLTLGNGTYSTVNYPEGWEEWKMTLNVEKNGETGFTFLSPFNKDFVEWKKESLVKLMKDYPFDGLELAESYLPEWDAISKGTYGDVGPNAAKAFKEQYDLEMLNFSDIKHPYYYKKHPDIYKKWVDFRVNAVNEFLNELINGKGGVREARPDALIATWSLAINDGPKSPEKLREDQGLDAVSMISTVKPDIHFFQTHWPDWIKSESELRPDYMKNYKMFVDQVKEKHPNVPIGLQADIGSSRSMIKSKKWVEAFDNEAKRYGYTTWTSYEYHIGGYMYTEKPTPQYAMRNSDKSIVIAFNKRIDETSAKNISNYVFLDNSNNKLDIDIIDIEVDGHWLILKLNKLHNERFKVVMNGIKDTPGLWLFKDFPANEIAEDSEVVVK